MTLRTVRRWRAPLPVPSGQEIFFGFGMLEELPNPLGSALWGALRLVETWAHVGVTRGSSPFPPDARAILEERLMDLPEREPVGPLRSLHGIVDGSVSLESAAFATRQIARWAATNQLPRTEAAFLEAATMLVPGDPVYAIDSGRVTLAAGDTSRAEAWFHRAVALARQQEDWDAYVGAQRWIAHSQLALGALRPSKRAMLRSMRAASRHGLRYRLAHALHGLLVICAELGELDEATDYGIQAARAYGPGHAEVPRLANDVATMWMDRGEFASALPVLRLAAPLVLHDHLGAWAGVARAAGGVGSRADFEEAVVHVRSMPADFALASAAYLDVARGACSLGDLTVAREWGEMALSTAERRGEAKTIFATEAFLESLTRVDVRQASTLPAELEPATGELCDALVVSLSAVEPAGV